MNESMDGQSIGVVKVNKTYREFIEEVFIKPIRTAVVVDDEFPTLDEFLLNPEAASKKRYAERAKDIISFCRARRPHPWIVDIHDGQNISLIKEGESATHFDHTDLLVLDYHLKGEQYGGDLAINLLKRLASNDHFNLVIIYTDNDVSNTLREIGNSLCGQERAKAFCAAKVDARVEETFQNWVDEGDEIVHQLIESIDVMAFIKAIYMDDLDFKKCFEIDQFLSFKSLLATKKIDYNPNHMLRLVLRYKLDIFLPAMADGDYGDLQLDESSNSEDGTRVNWLRIDSLFLTIIKKSEVSPEQFSNRLISAIASWDPSPHRLIVTKMRSEIGRRGVMVEKEVLQNPYLQAAWLKGLFDVGAAELRTNVRRNVVKHWDSLGARVEPSVVAFAEDLSSFLSSNDVSFERFQNPAYSKSSLMALHVNHHVCSKPIEGHHLFTGHVFKIDEEFWVCLTPACDMEPGRKVGKGINKDLGAWKPFKAAKIEPLLEFNSALANAARGHHLFLGIDGSQPTAFAFSLEAEPTLKWQQFYAKDQGYFEPGTYDFNLMLGKDEAGLLKFESKVAKVVAQLRYEYALHLLHRLGNHLSRVGLEFISYQS
ncbi:hypothetical protein GIW45_23950 [Pseudomonas congelans]|uniref:response regulator receiver domain n=1 Tax=Pseudomonas congelans TaxID=200452 RepID=UPI001F36A20B|nr:response regulator receiver domain [Pseudomonas congelans]MCF5167037.1 hypothetical protein [Pseudomonas congelans]